jgi:hypothetical protein
MRKLSRNTIRQGAVTDAFHTTLMARYDVLAAQIITDIALDISYRLAYDTLTMVVYLEAERVYKTLATPEVV